MHLDTTRYLSQTLFFVLPCFALMVKVFLTFQYTDMVFKYTCDHCMFDPINNFLPIVNMFIQFCVLCKVFVVLLI